MSTAKQIAGWREIPKSGLALGIEWITQDELERDALRERLRDTAAALAAIASLDDRDALAILAGLAEEGLTGSAQEGKS